MDNTVTDNTQLAETGGQHKLMESLGFPIPPPYTDGLNGNMTQLNEAENYFRLEIEETKKNNTTHTVVMLL